MYDTSTAANENFQYFAQLLATSFTNVWGLFLGLTFALLGTLVVLLVGLFVAAGLGKLIEKIFDAVRIDEVFENAGLKPYFERANMRIRIAYFLGRVVYWFVIVAFLLVISDFLELDSFSSFLRDVLSYIPNVVAAVLIMLAAVVIGNFLRGTVRASVMGARMHSAQFLGALTWWAIVIFGFFTALLQLRVAETVVNALITGFIAMLALAGGLAFGLGGKDYANHLLNKLREETESKR
ncbi:MAG: hypothetical protein AAB691_00375 [Patescibacteria group bacterium]